MKIVLLAPANSIHTVQWAKYLSLNGEDVYVISQHKKSADMPSHIPVYILPYQGLLGYFLNAKSVNRILADIQPDIVHTHYASGYGTTARLVNYSPCILSVWGSDVYDFPYKSKLHHWLLRKNLYAADELSSTSYCMMEQTLEIASKLSEFSVIPFGVDFNKFKIDENTRKETNYITIGTVKTLSEKYGIDLLIKSFSILYKNLSILSPEIAHKLRLRIVGGGEQEKELKDLVIRLGIANITNFVGQVSHHQVPAELQKLDIYVALSRWESFGVAIIEAGAMNLPVVVSNVGGLPEVVKDGETGFVVPKESPESAAEMLEKLVLDVQLREVMGKNAHKFVKENFSWDICISKMKELYQEVINK